MIYIENAYENNLKHINSQIPEGKITGLTGVSGSGKSTLLRNVLASYGSRRLSYLTTKTVNNALGISNHIKVGNVKNLSQTILIDVKSNVNNPSSTVSTVSGTHEILRNLFEEYGIMECPKCGISVGPEICDKNIYIVDLEINESFKLACDYLLKNGEIIREEFYDKNGEIAKTVRARAFATLYFKLFDANEKKIKEFNKTFSCRIRQMSESHEQSFDVLTECECSKCKQILPVLNRSRLSFNTAYSQGGGACQQCAGTGKKIELNYESLIRDEKKGIFQGAIEFVGDKGIKYTTITEKCIEAVLKKIGRNTSDPLEQYTKKQLEELFYGLEAPLKFTDRVGGKKEIVFEGISNYLIQSFLSGKGEKAIAPILSEKICPCCKGTRIDSRISTFKYHNRNISEILQLSFEQLEDVLRDIEYENGAEQVYIERLLGKVENYRKVSCGHLTLDRASNTLSGGELQRIRLCSLLNSNVTGICYLLDEPSSGLHYDDIEKLGSLLYDICQNGNTIIMVEHNLKLLSFCDYIVDLGPKGGKDGGNILFQDDIKEVRNYKTATADLFMQRSDEHFENRKRKCFERTMKFDQINENNLKNITVSIPIGTFSTVCGVSGSGKSTLVKYLYKKISKAPEKYGFDEVDYLGQDSRSNSSQSTVGSLLKINDYIAKAYESISGKPRKAFMPGNMEGKCSCCKGSGIILSDAKENLGICDQCGGKGYEKSILSVKWNEYRVYDLFNASFSELKEKMTDKKIQNIAHVADMLGIGYLSFSRASRSLSKGEYQRVFLMNILINKSRNHLIILDEPSKGMHNSDICKLISALNDVINTGNTIIAVEHNPFMIKHSDYMIEFGGTGKTGGILLYAGSPMDINDTPTKRMITNGIQTHVKNVKQETEADYYFESGLQKSYYAPGHFYDVLDKDGTILNIGKSTMNDFLSVAIPNNIFFSRSKGVALKGRVPIIHIIDFGEKSRLNSSIAHSTGISDVLSAIANEADNTSEILKYVFDELSVTGKCKKCNGSGWIYTVDSEYFFAKGELTAECKKFLRNSTNYSECSKLIKKQLGIDISKWNSTKSEEEKAIFLWGEEQMLHTQNGDVIWKGLMDNFIQFYNYYPDKDAKIVARKKLKSECPCCRGKMLQREYENITVMGLTYYQWYTMDIGKIKTHLDCYTVLGEKEGRIIDCIDELVHAGLGNVCLSTLVSSLGAKEWGKIKTVSLLENSIYKSGMMFVNQEQLDEKEKVWLNTVVERLLDCYSIWNVLGGETNNKSMAER